MQTSNKARAVHSLESNPDSEDESPRSTGREVTMVTRTDQALLEAVQHNTIAVQRLMEQMAAMPSQTAPIPLIAGRRPSGGRSRNRCWKCGEPGNEDRSATRVACRPLAH